MDILTIVKDINNQTKEFKGGFKDKISHLNNPLYNKIFQSVNILEKDNLVLFRYASYSDIMDGEINFSNFWDLYDGLYRSLRSVVVDVENETIVIYPFDKFFNINELEETNIDNIKSKIENAKCVEFSDKLDGSMQCARYYNGNIVVIGSNSIDENDSWRLQSAYNMINSDENLTKLITENPNYTFIFESLTVEDAHVVKYNDDEMGLHLIGMRNMNSFLIEPYNIVLDYARKYNILTTSVFNTTLDKVMNSLDDKKSNEKEGFVVNIDGYYVKIKYNDYVCMHRVISKLSSINLVIKNYAENTIDDLISKVPSAYKERVFKIIKILDEYTSSTQKLINEWFYL